IYLLIADLALRTTRPDLVRCSFSLWRWRIDFRNSVVAIERAGIWQLSLGCGVDSLQFHGGLGARKCARRILENSAMASAPFVRCVGGPRRILWVHDCFWPSSAWRVDAARMANALELSADAARTAIHRVFPGAAGADDSNGLDLTGDSPGSSAAAS